MHVGASSILSAQAGVPLVLFHHVVGHGIERHVTASPLPLLTLAFSLRRAMEPQQRSLPIVSCDAGCVFLVATRATWWITMEIYRPDSILYISSHKTKARAR